MSELLVGVFFIMAGVAWAEIREWLPFVARKVVARAVLNLPVDIRERMHEELTAELGAVPGKISPLWFACSLWWGFSRSNLLGRVEHSLSRYTVRTLDLTIASLGLVFLFPMSLVVLTALLCAAITKRQKVQWSHEVLGLDGVPFRALVFRTQPHGAPSVEAAQLNDFLQYTGLCDMPKLINVLRGEMSMVGACPVSPNSRHAPALAASGLKPGMCWRVGDQILNPGARVFGHSLVVTVRLYFNFTTAGLHRLFVGR